MPHNTETDSEYLSKGPCSSCGSSDANALYSDGHSYCFSCGTHTPAGDAPATSQTERKALSKGLIPIGHAEAIQKRLLTRETCARYGYTLSEMGGKTVQVANYRDPETGEVVAQKVRGKDKTFCFLGDTKKAGLFGQHLWKGGRRIFITEGEIDALTVFQVMGHKWPVVSVPNGAQGARKAIAAQLQWLLTFDEVVLVFDNDEQGIKATEECVTLFPPGKARTAMLPLKDPSDMLQAGRSQELIQRLWEAKVYRPDGLVTLSDLEEKVMEVPVIGLPWFDERLTEATFGRRYGECVAVGAGTGIGKTDFITQQICFDLSHDNAVAVFMLEQQPVETAKRIAGKFAEKRFHIPDGSWNQDELKGAVQSLLGKGRLFLYDNFGATDWQVIRDRIRYLAHAEGVRLYYLDHLTALAAAEEDERVALERIMAELGALVQELNVWLLFVSHLATPEKGAPHEEGGRVTIRQFKGSRSIGFWSHLMIGLERNQQAEEETDRSTTVLRVLKDRYTGQATGKVFPFGYNATTGMMIPVEQMPEGASEYGF